MDSSTAGEISQLAAATSQIPQTPTSAGRRAAIKSPADRVATANAPSGSHSSLVQQKRERARKRREQRKATTSARDQIGMEGLIPFVIDVIRKSNERSGYRSVVSSDGGSSRGGGSRRHLIDYSELPDAPAAAANLGVDRPSGMLHRRARSEYVETMEHARPAPVVAGPAYRRK